MQKNLKISKMELTNNGETVNVYTNITESYFKSLNLYEFRYQMWRLADIMDGLEERRFNNEFKNEQFLYYEILKLKNKPSFNIVGVCQFRLNKDFENKLKIMLDNLHIQSGSSKFGITFQDKRKKHF